MNKVAIYARYSSELQSDASIEDQVRLCQEHAKKEGWTLAQTYNDAATSGASLMRPGIQSLIADALAGNFNIVLCEALDRLSRDQEDIAGIFKRMEFADVKIITLSEGLISTLHIGLKGTMNALFLKDLADKTRRGLRGKVESGKSGGGLAYGYKVAKNFDARGEAVRGEREIDQDQSIIVRRIFSDYAHRNLSPKAIAAQLNAEGIPCPSGKTWGQSTINGNRKRGTGILNNELYIGRLVWNRQRMIKDPASGKRLSRLNDESEWITQSIPNLRVVDQELWDAVKARQKTLEQSRNALWKSNRPQYLLSGLLKCGVCSGGYAKINSTHYGCAAAKNKGSAVCKNKKTIKREKLEAIVLDALETRLMRGDMLELFCEEYTRHMNHLIKNEGHQREKRLKNLAKHQTERLNLITALKNGVEASLIKDELEGVTDQIKILERALETSKETKRPLLHPAMAERYKSGIKALRQSFIEAKGNREIGEHIRALVEKIVLTPNECDGHLVIDLHGDIAGLIRMASGKDADASLDNLSALGNIPIYGNASQGKQDRVGSGGWI